MSEHEELKLAVLKYLSEFDNLVPDYGYRRTLRNYLRTLTGAPKEMPPRLTGTANQGTSGSIR